MLLASISPVTFTTVAWSRQWARIWTPLQSTAQRPECDVKPRVAGFGERGAIISGSRFDWVVEGGLGMPHLNRKRGCSQSSSSVLNGKSPDALSAVSTGCSANPGSTLAHIRSLAQRSRNLLYGGAGSPSSWPPVFEIRCTSWDLEWPGLKSVDEVRAEPLASLVGSGPPARCPSSRRLHRLRLYPTSANGLCRNSETGVRLACQVCSRRLPRSPRWSWICGNRFAHS